MDTLLEDIWQQIIGNDWRVYRSLLAVPKFARCAMKDPIKWRRLLAVEHKCEKYTQWTLADKIHREDGLPAVIWTDGSQEWYQHGKYHRDGIQPTVIWANGGKEWHRYGQLHRDGDLPALECANGGRYWYQYGKRCRDARSGDHGI